MLRKCGIIGRVVGENVKVKNVGNEHELWRLLLKLLGGQEQALNHGDWTSGI